MYIHYLLLKLYYIICIIVIFLNKVTIGIELNIEENSERILTTNCIFMKTAFIEHEDVSNSHVQPYLFRPFTKLFDVTYFAVPGDEKYWRQYHSKYPWNMILGTHVFIATLFTSPLADIDPFLIDVGANMGQEAVIVASLGGLVMSFEPLPKAYNQAKFNLRANCVSDRVQLFNYGVGDSISTIQVSNNGFSSISTNSQGYDTQWNVNVSITTLDTQFFKPQSEINKMYLKRALLLKLDSEGHELEALHGATKLLSEFPPLLILTEVGVHSEVTIEVLHKKLEAFGYSKVFVLCKDDAIVDSKFDENYFKDYWSRPYEIKPKQSSDFVGDVIFEHTDATTKRLKFSHLSR